jgi:putative Mg2+ transporter-C (MgtC) family protein
MLLQVVLSGVLAGVIGFQRYRRGRPAGLRTHAVVAMASACFTLAGGNAFWSEVHDPTRIAAQVASGIGFLGAGTIFRYRDTVLGLTTAATLWLAAAIGVLVGAGGSWLAVGVTIVVFVTLTFGTVLEGGGVGLTGQGMPGLVSTDDGPEDEGGQGPLP